jgi:hypothetical protein
MGGKKERKAEKGWIELSGLHSLNTAVHKFHKYGNVFVNGTEPANLFPLTLTLSPIEGEGIEQDPW